MTTIPCHILVQGNPSLVYASRNGRPEKVLPTLSRFLDKFWQERDASGEIHHTPQCLIAQIVVRFGFEICEDDYSNLRVGVQYAPDVQFLYEITSDRQLRVWIPNESYQADPSVGLSGCQQIQPNPALLV